MPDTTRLELDFDTVAVLRDMAQQYLDTPTGITDDDDIETRRQLLYERSLAANLYERADAAVKRIAARV